MSTKNKTAVAKHVLTLFFNPMAFHALLKIMSLIRRRPANGQCQKDTHNHPQVADTSHWAGFMKLTKSSISLGLVQFMSLPAYVATVVN